MKKMWNYFKDSWEGTDGKASSKKLSMLAFVITMLVYAWHVETLIHLYVFWTFAVLFAILIGIMSWTNLMALLKFTLPLAKDKARDENQQKDNRPEQDDQPLSKQID